MLWIRSAIYFGFMVLSAIVFGVLAVFARVMPFNKRAGFIGLFARSNIWFLQLVCGLKFEVEGRENIPKQGFICMAKHQSTWETYAFQQILPPITWILKRELLRVPFFGWGLASLEPIAIERGSGKKAIMQIIKEGTDRLQKGRMVLIFPEGTRIAPGKRGEYKIGGGMLAAKSGFPVLPIAHNAGEYWARHSFVKKPGVIKMVIGKPIETQGKKADEIMREVESFIEGEMARITTLREHQHGDRPLQTAPQA
ncbi:MAG: 1-acyl-sn-glycerol-3-phosphate acyltransferase [Gammaproteobacteria bacterium]|nr:1-acyl-sn-glycerol-3-phosphate acyltransferase [Gammaproteobacteria bacterium]